MSVLAALALACTNTEQPAPVEGTPGWPRVPDGPDDGTISQPGDPAQPGSVVIDPPEVPELAFEAIDLPGVNAATDFAFLPNRPGELLVLSHDGNVHLLRLTLNQATRLAGTSLQVFRDEGCGLLSLTIDPEFEENGFVYLTRCVDTRTSWLTRHVFDFATALEPQEVNILRVETDQDPPEDWHRFGSLGFEPDGETLWILLGDHFLRQNAQEPANPFGSLLRIRPDRSATGSGHLPAAGNDIGVANADPRVYAYGLRSPWRAARDRRGRFFVGDVGEYRREEVDLITAPGQNLGWPRFEGPCLADCGDFVNPVASYGRTSDEPYVFDDPDTDPETRRAVWVGDVYGGGIDRYYGLFDDAVPFGDFFAGWVRLLRVDEAGSVVDDRLVAHLTDITSWHTGPDGYMYVLTLDGTLRRAIQVVDPPQ